MILTNVERLTLLIKKPPEPEKIILQVGGIAAKLDQGKVNPTDFLISLVASVLSSEFSDLRSAINNKKVLTLTDARGSTTSQKIVFTSQKPNPEKKHLINRMKSLNVR